MNFPQRHMHHFPPPAGASFGGGSSSYNTATHILFYTASNNTSTYAVEQKRFRIHNDTNCEVIAVISIVDRQEGAVESFAAAGIKFESIMNRSDVAEL